MPVVLPRSNVTKSIRAVGDALPLRPPSPDIHQYEPSSKRSIALTHQDYCPELQQDLDELMQDFGGSLTPSLPSTTKSSLTWNSTSSSAGPGTPATNSKSCFGEPIVLPDRSFFEQLNSFNANSNPSKHASNGLLESHESFSVSPVSLDFQDAMRSEAVRSADTSLRSTTLQSVNQAQTAWDAHHPPAYPDNSEVHCCFTTAYSTLGSLHFQSQYYSSFSSSTCFPNSPELPSTSIPTLDHILGTTKIAISNVSTLLKCSCASDPHLAILYASIVSKILNWYQFAGGIRINSFLPNTAAAALPATRTTANESKHGFESSMGPGVPTIPIKIGAFSPDNEDQEALRWQLLLRALRKVGLLIDTLATSHIESRNDMGESEGGLYGILGAWLKSELLRTIREMSERAGTMLGID
ncbi:hypothetical protein MMC12_000368 [Toensbergia leucococca]|nr:hypothetical protein [Toensbergia leucococca]